MTARRWSLRRDPNRASSVTPSGSFTRAALRCCRQLLYEAGLMDLARRRAGELCRCAKSEPRRYFVACQPLTAEGDDRRGISCRPAPQLDRCGDDLALRPIRDSHDIGLHDVRV